MKQKKKLAAKLLKTSPSKVKFSPEALADIQKAITRSDMRGLIAIGKIQRERPNEQSRVRARKIAVQKAQGQRGGRGSKKGRKYALVSRKDQWIMRIRVQRAFLQQLYHRGLVSQENYHQLYAKSKGGFFRNKRHIKLYLTEHHLIERR